MPLLPWITDQDLFKIVGDLLHKAREARSNSASEFGKNVIDPFSALFEISAFELTFDTWTVNETTRQSQKTLQNHIGDFHQQILGCVKGWKDMKKGQVVDLVSDSQRVVAEIKNKYNTLSGGKLSDLYYSLDSIVMPKSSIYRGYTAYYVVVIPKTPLRYDRPFVPSDKNKGEKCQLNENIREIDGASFYQFVTGYPNALEQLFDVLPQAIHKVSGGELSVKDPEKLKEFFAKAYK